MRDQTERALAGADVVMFVIDARTGITPIDRHFAEWLRERPVPVVLITNQCEGNAGNAGFYDAFELGFGEPVPLSAEHGAGLRSEERRAGKECGSTRRSRCAPSLQQKKH